MKDQPDTASDYLEGFVYRVPGPEGSEHRWIARSVHGHVAHGRTAESAAQNLEAGVEALAKASGQTLADWQLTQSRDGVRFLRSGELVQG